MRRVINHIDSILISQVIAGNDLLAVSPSQYNLLDEPSPLGLRLKKTPSFLDLIQMKLSQGAATASNITAVQSTTVPPDKVKASNFPASLLRIGQWEVNLFTFSNVSFLCLIDRHC